MRFRQSQKPCGEATTEKTRQGQVLLLFLPSSSVLASLMCPADSETGFGHRHHRFEFNHGGRQTLGRMALLMEMGMEGKCPFSVFRTTTTKATKPRHNNNNNRSGAPNGPNRTEISFGDQLLASVCLTDSICVCHHGHRSVRSRMGRPPLPLIPTFVCSVLLSHHN